MTPSAPRRRRGGHLSALVAAALLASSGVGAQGPQAPPEVPAPSAAEPTATPPAEAETFPPAEDLPTEIEGVTLDQTLLAVSRRLELGSLVPGRSPSGDVLRYVLDVQRMLPSPVRDRLTERRVGRMELEFRRERVSSVKVEYLDQRDTPFAEMGRSLTRRYGPPTRSTASGPLQVGRAKGLRLYLWLEIWAWERDGRTYTVEGKHYGDDKVREESKRHAYAYQLEAAP